MARCFLTTASAESFHRINYEILTSGTYRYRFNTHTPTIIIITITTMTAIVTPAAIPVMLLSSSEEAVISTAR